MIYALTTLELNMLKKISGYKASRLSPATSICQKADQFTDTDNILQGLESMGLIYNLPDVPPALTSEGTLIAKALFLPMSTVSFGRKKAFDNLSHALQLNNLWYIFTYIPQKEICILYAYLSSQMLAEWINSQVLKNFTPTMKMNHKFSVELTYEEWITFLASQVLFIKRELSPTKNNSSVFDRNSLINPEISRFFKSTLQKFSMNKFIEISNQLFSDNKKVLDKAISGLVKKDIFITSKNQQGAEIITYTPNTIYHIDNDLLLDTAVFNLRRNHNEYILFLSLRKAGITTMFDTGNSVHISTMSKIPWLTYLQ